MKKGAESSKRGEDQRFPRMTKFAKSKLEKQSRKKTKTIIDEGYNLPKFYDKSYDDERNKNKYEIKML